MKEEKNMSGLDTGALDLFEPQGPVVNYLLGKAGRCVQGNYHNLLRKGQ